MSELMVTTYSMWKLFCNCRKAFEYRYIKKLVPKEIDDNLFFGSVIHECLEIWHRKRKLEKVIKHLNQIYANRARDDHKLSNWHLATAMMSSYSEQYPIEDFDVIALEKTFEGPIINPDTNAVSRSFVLAGKVDGLVQQDGQYFILEHKTASQIDAGYLERLWTDFQIIIYAWYLEHTLGIRISGIIYNILVKAKLRQIKGETEAEFESRRAELIAKSKTGKSSAKRKMPEPDDVFQQRLKDKYLEPVMFHREWIYISPNQFEQLQKELWELSINLLDAIKRNKFYRNTSFCFKFNRPCPYFPICRSNESINIISNYYEIREPNEELKTKKEANYDSSTIN